MESFRIFDGICKLINPKNYRNKYSLLNMIRNPTQPVLVNVDKPLRQQNNLASTFFFYFRKLHDVQHFGRW